MIRVFRTAIGIAALVCLWPGFAAACPQLPPGLRASVRAVNLNDPIPANGALVFRLTCWHDCTPCQAAEQAILVDLRDASGRAIPGGKPEQIFPSSQPLQHLVVWRPLALLEAGAHYTLQASVIGQDDTTMSSSDLVVNAAVSPLPLEHSFSARMAAYREERGTIFHCDVTQNDCDVRFLSFGDQYAMLPALTIAADPPSAGQIIYRVRDKTISSNVGWESWSSGGEIRDTWLRYREAHDPSCAEVEARSLVDGGPSTVFSLCAPLGDLDAPSIHSTEMDALDSQMLACSQPPADLQDRWCAQKRSSCMTNFSVGCMYVDHYCGTNPWKGSSSSEWAEPKPAPPKVDELCASPRDPYVLVAGGGCHTGRGRGPAPRTAVMLLGLLVCLRRRTRIRRQILGFSG